MNKLNIIILLICLINIYIIIEFNKYDIISNWNDIKINIQAFIIINFILTIILVGYLFLYISKQTLNNSLLLFGCLTILTILSIISLIICSNPYNLDNPNKIIKWIYGIQILIYGFLIILYNKYLLINSSLYDLTMYMNTNYPECITNENIQDEDIMNKINKIIN